MRMGIVHRLDLQNFEFLYDKGMENNAPNAINDQKKGWITNYPYYFDLRVLTN